MREKTLGRWVVRVACVIGVGVAVLGGAAVVNAAEISSVTGKITPVDTTTGGNSKSGPIYTTDDVIWV
jgi:hypothetical protein